MKEFFPVLHTAALFSGISDDELAARRAKMLAKGADAYKPVRDRKVSKALQFYAKNVSSAADGAVRRL